MISYDWSKYLITDFQKIDESKLTKKDNCKNYDKRKCKDCFCCPLWIWEEFKLKL